MYIRADLKKVIIKRKYQKFMEFYADASSLLVAIYEILDIIFKYIDTFYGHHSVSQKIFFFKELENTEHFNILKKSNVIRELIKITDLQKTNSENTPSKIESKGNKNSKNYPPKKQISNKKDEIKENDIKKYNNKNPKQTIEKEPSRNSNYVKGKDTENKKLYNISSDKRILDEKYSEYIKDDFVENYPRYKVNQMRNNKNRDAILNFKYNNRKNDEFNESIGTNIEEFSSDTDGSRIVKRKKKEAIENSFNILEIIITQIFKCCMSKNMKIKNDINEKANNIIFQKMDIITYIRNMLLLDLINQTTLDNNKKEIINFLYRPIISVDKKVKNEFNEIYDNYNEKNFNKYYDDIQDLVNKPQKNDKEKELIYISNEHLKSFL